MNWKYIENYEESKSKWIEFISQLEDMIKDPKFIDTTGGVITPLGHCGFCCETVGRSIREFDPLVLCPSCDECELSKDDTCINIYEHGKSTIFWRIMKSFNSGNLTEALELSKIMLSKIEACKPTIINPDAEHHISIQISTE